MNIATAQKRIDRIADAMVAKGMREPHAQLNIKSQAELSVMLRWRSGLGHEAYSDDQYEFFRGSAADALDKADAFVSAQPDIEQQKLTDFLRALGTCIDLGKQHGIEADYLNPLLASMKKLSENIITDQRAAYALAAVQE